MAQQDKRDAKLEAEQAKRDAKLKAQQVKFRKEQAKRDAKMKAERDKRDAEFRKEQAARRQAGRPFERLDAERLGENDKKPASGLRTPKKRADGWRRRCFARPCPACWRRRECLWTMWCLAP